MYTITVSQKGQVVLPSSLRKKYNIKKGTKLRVDDSISGIVITPAGTSHISAMRGALKSEESITEFLVNERAKEYGAMDKKWKK